MNLEAWHQAGIDDEAAMLAEGVSYLACELDGKRYVAPMGSAAPSPEVAVETVYATGSR